MRHGSREKACKHNPTSRVTNVTAWNHGFGVAAGRVLVSIRPVHSVVAICGILGAFSKVRHPLNLCRNQSFLC